jgi:hypothetical protein
MVSVRYPVSSPCWLSGMWNAASAILPPTVPTYVQVPMASIRYLSGYHHERRNGGLGSRGSERENDWEELPADTRRGMRRRNAEGEGNDRSREGTSQGTPLTPGAR